MKLTEYVSYLLILLITLVLSGCTASDEPFVVDEPEIQDTPLSFSAYLGRNSRTAATADEINDVDALAQVGGFGVFGYAHGLRNFDDYILDVTVPRFMVNQQVWNESQNSLPEHKGDGNASENWLYAPIRYYDNNEGAKHSFFAYAPYDKDVDMVYTKDMAPQLRYDISQDVDLLWAVPTKNMKKPGVGTKITFNFAHALTKTTFHVAPFVDEVHSDGNHSDAGHTHPNSIPLTDGTTIKVKSIHLNGTIPFQGRMNTETGKWAYEKTGQYFDVPNASNASWTGDGTSIKEYYLVGSSKLIPTQDVTIEVTYDVITDAGPTKNHITHKAVSHETFNLDQGKAYNFYLDLGLNTVKFFATATDWIIGYDPEPETILLENIIPWQAGVSEDVEW